MTRSERGSSFQRTSANTATTTIISGLHDRKDAKEITRQLKTKIGTGGTFKDGQIILQGDHREAVKNLLVSMGFPAIP